MKQSTNEVSEDLPLFTAQEVAGLNPAEVTQNEGVNASSFLFRVQIRVQIYLSFTLFCSIRTSTGNTLMH